MSQGKLGTPSDLSAATDTLIFTAAELQVFNVRICNRNSTAVRVRIAIGTGGSPAVADYILYDYSIPANGTREDFGQVCSSGEKVWVRTDLANVSVRIFGV